MKLRPCHCCLEQASASDATSAEVALGALEHTHSAPSSPQLALETQQSEAATDAPTERSGRRRPAWQAVAARLRSAFESAA